jgi:hypothetical protein
VPASGGHGGRVSGPWQVEPTGGGTPGCREQCGCRARWCALTLGRGRGSALRRRRRDRRRRSPGRARAGRGPAPRDGVAWGPRIEGRRLVELEVGLGIEAEVGLRGSGDAPARSPRAGSASGPRGHRGIASRTPWPRPVRRRITRVRLHSPPSPRTPGEPCPFASRPVPGSFRSGKPARASTRRATARAAPRAG